MKLARNLRGDLLWAALAGSLAVMCARTQPPTGTPDAAPTPSSIATLVEGGIAVLNGTCTLLEGVTDNQTLISICASAEEVAGIVQFISGLLRHGETADAGPCTIIPGSTLCATKSELGRAITFTVQKRRAVFFKDASP